MDVKKVYSTVLVEISFDELNEMVGSIKAMLTWIANRSACANGTIVIDLEKNLTKTFNELRETLNYMRK